MKFFCVVLFFLNSLVWANGSDPEPSGPELSNPELSQNESFDVGPDFQTLQNFSQLTRQIGMDLIYKSQTQAAKKRVRIAIFDNSFGDFEKQRGLTLPDDLVYYPGISPKQSNTPSIHGLKMAETVYAFMTNQGQLTELAPQFYLFRVTGFTNFQVAIQEAIRLNVDIVLHTIVREFGGNFDGTGLFNSEVQKATDAGIIWINAAGNFASTTFNLNKIETNNDGWVLLPGPNQSLPIRCRPPGELTSCRVKIVLSWNSFTNSVTEGTDKNLDLYLTDDTLNIIGGSSLIQTRAITMEGQTLFPRETIELSLLPGRYFLRIKNRSSNFSNQDRLRIVGNGQGLSFEVNHPEESVLSPADHPDVLTIGAWDSPLSSRSLSLAKPEILAPSIFEFPNEVRFAGSSNAAAIAAAAVGLLMSDGEAWNLADLKSALTRPRKERTGVLSLDELGFLPLTEECFDGFHVNSQAPYIKNLTSSGGLFVKTTHGIRVMVPFDPILLAINLRRRRFDDMILATPTGWKILPRADIHQIPSSWLEVFSWSPEVLPCRIPIEWQERYKHLLKAGPELNLTGR